MNKTTSFLFFIGIILIGCNTPKKDPTPDPSNDTGIITLDDQQMKYIKEDTVKKINDEDILILNGKVSFDQNKVTKVFPVTGGTVIKIYPGIGDYVKKSDVLAILKGGDVSTFQNDYTVAKANLEVSRKNADIAKELFKTNVYSEKDKIAAENELKKAQAEFNKSKSYLESMGIKEDNVDASYTILAPTDGFIVERNVSENTIIRPDNSNNLFTISSLKTVWVMADLYENDISKIKLHDSVDIKTIAYPDKVLKGKVEQIGSFLDPQSRVVKVKVVLDNSDGLLKPEMYASVKITTYFPDFVLAVPTKALVLQGDKYVVMVAGPNKTFTKRAITILRTIDNLTLLKNGVNENEIIVTEGSLLVSNNNAAK